MTLDDIVSLPAFVHLYEGTGLSNLNVPEIAGFLEQFLPLCTASIREDFFRYWFQRDRQGKTKSLIAAERLARARVKRPDRHDLNANPLPGEIDFEQRFLTQESNKPLGILYDGYRLVGIYSEFIAPAEMTMEHCHVVLTNQLLGTWDERDFRYHVRASIYGFPSLISVAGIVEGPAKPREYYLAKRLSLDRAGSETRCDERYIGHGDIRLQEVIKGLLMQVIFYHSTGDPFCNDRNCRLFNAHWQEEMIHAQLRKGADLCAHHRQVLKGLSCE